MQRWFSILQNFFSTFHMPVLRISDVVEVCIIAFLIYHILAWVKNTRAWSLLMGVLVIAAFVILAALFNMTTAGAEKRHRGAGAAQYPQFLSPV